uniref:Charged multivesicular body protein 7 n=1 Tax=Callorhinchus milii TaxID=7868 RepID=A0A4W3JD10_CALMI
MSGWEAAEACAEDWADDERMAHLFSAFKRSREVNSRDWDSKMGFWAALVARAARGRGLSFSLADLQLWFLRKGSAPLGLRVVLDDMIRRGLIQKESNFAANVDASWLAWGVGLLLVKPLKWTLSSMLGTDQLSPDESFVLVELVEEKAAQVLQLCQKSLHSSHPVGSFAELQAVCLSTCPDDRSFYLALLQLQKEKRVAVAELDGEKIVKFARSSHHKVSPVNEIDIGIFQLMRCEKLLNQKVESLSEDAERCKKEAQSYLKTGKKQLALKCLKTKKKSEKRLENIHAKLDTIQTILDRIYSSQSDKMVVDAYQAGLGALKQSMKDVTVSKVESLMDQIEEFCDTQEDINQAIAGANLGPAGAVDMDELEEELNTLLAEVTQEESKLPDVPSTPLPWSSSASVPAADLIDHELEAELSKLTLSDTRIQAGAVDPASTNKALLDPTAL